MSELIQTPALWGGKHHQKPNAITLPAKHPATVILVLSRELILFVMSCLRCCWVGSRDSVTEYPIGRQLWLSMPHYLLTGHFMLTTACHYKAHLRRVTGCRDEYKDIEPCIHIHKSLFLTDSWNCLVFGCLHGLNSLSCYCSYYCLKSPSQTGPPIIYVQ